MQNKDLLKLGGIGAVAWFMAAAAMLAFSIVVMLSAAPFVQAGMDSELAILAMMAQYNSIGMAGAVLEILGILALSAGAFGLSKQYKSQLCGTTAILGLIATAFSFLSLGADWAGLISVIFTGIFLILLGLSIKDMGAKTKVRMTRNAGILTLLTGVLYVTVYGTLFAYILGLPAMALLAMVFLKAK